MGSNVTSPPAILFFIGSALKVDPRAPSCGRPEGRPETFWALEMGWLEVGGMTKKLIYSLHSH